MPVAHQSKIKLELFSAMKKNIKINNIKSNKISNKLTIYSFSPLSRKSFPKCKSFQKSTFEMKTAVLVSKDLSTEAEIRSAMKCSKRRVG
jgi:hypothetical protein